MQNNDVIAIGRQGIFSLEQAQQLMPVLRKITQEYSQQVDQRIARLEALDSRQKELIEELEAEINDLIQEWHHKVKKLGGVPKGLWIVDFDSGSGYFCWKYPESHIMYWHKYTDGFTKRIPVAELTEKAPCPISKEPVLVREESLEY